MSSAGVAIVTGAARGLGSEIARALARDGWRLMLVDSCADNPAIPYPLARERDLDETASACRAVATNPDDVESAIADVTDQHEIDAAVQRAVESFGGLDAAVAAAGVIAGGTPGWQTSDDVWGALLNVNLTGVWRLANASIPALLARDVSRRGRFIAISSAAGVRGFPMLAAYAAAKHGVIGLVRSLSAELGESGVTANVVCPGSMDTEMLTASAQIYGVDNVQEFARYHVSKRLLQPAEVAAVVVWLCSAASGGMTGAVIPVDSGMTAV
jgi:SDR family mycofactocin-dependent oxidoreductase